MSSTYDLIVLGGGPAGYFASEQAGRAGLKTLCVEKEHLGGVCLNEGCLPTKSLLNSVKVYSHAKNGEALGVLPGSLSYSHDVALKRKDEVVEKLVAGVKRALKTAGCEYLAADGRILGSSAQGVQVEAGDKTYTCKNLLIATGSAAVIPPIKGMREAVEAGFAVTSRELLSMSPLPESIVLIGAGVIGLEIASYLSQAGVRVTAVEMLDHAAGSMDREIASMVQSRLEELGVTFMLSTGVTEITADGVRWKNQNSEGEIKTSLVLVCAGRRANTAGLGLESIGVQTDRGAIVTDRFMKTNVPGVYAAGDVNGKVMLAHTAYREAAVAVNNILGKRDVMRYDAIPSVIYTDPEAASVGLTEAEAGDDCKLIRLDANYSGRFMAENENGRGLLKLVCQKTTGRILGMQFCGTYASEFIAQAAAFIELGLCAPDIKEIVFPHPTVCEILREAAFRF